jgi:hypothetical protein
VGEGGRERERSTRKRRHADCTMSSASSNGSQHSALERGTACACCVCFRCATDVIAALDTGGFIGLEHMDCLSSGRSTGVIRFVITVNSGGRLSSSGGRSGGLGGLGRIGRSGRGSSSGTHSITTRATASRVDARNNSSRGSRSHKREKKKAEFGVAHGFCSMRGKQPCEGAEHARSRCGRAARTQAPDTTPVHIQSQCFASL